MSERSERISGAASETIRHVRIERTEPGRFTIVNDRDGRITIGTGDDASFTPTELLLGAIGGCTSIDVDILTSRRAEPESFVVEASGTKVRDSDGNRMTDLAVTFHLVFPAGDAGDAAREVLPAAVQRSHDQLCTVSRTVELGTPVSTTIAG